MDSWLTPGQLDRFQEWPQLLDPSLAALIELLTGAFVDYLVASKTKYGPPLSLGSASTSPLPRAICRLLYSFCKVRGYKVIVGLLNNEPKNLGPMVSSFRAWDRPGTGMAWEERYVMLLWLSHLILAPFELTSISMRNGDAREAALPDELADLPLIAGEIVSMALQHLQGAGKEREAAGILLVRLSLRKDLQLHNLHKRLVKYAIRQLLSDNVAGDRNSYQSLGFLSLLYGITNSGGGVEVATHLPSLFAAILQIATDQSGHFPALRDAAPARKWVLKITRSVLVHAMSLRSRQQTMDAEQVNHMLEESIQYFLDALGDKDTPVRMAAAKSLSVVALKLDPAMSSEVVEAVLGCLQENILLEDVHSQRLVAITDNSKTETSAMKRNISAVDSLRWHGLMLTLAHLLFRRSPPPDLLPDIVQALILGLEFEQRSNVGTSLGVGVRDAACFGLWALARKYSTAELERVSLDNFSESNQNEYSNCKSVLQLVATKLVNAACLDPSGNIRRGSSAALQELIGRHPDTIAHGIPVVQVVEYNAVARLTRAMAKVAPQAARLDVVYHIPLLQALIEWRGARAAEVHQRRWAANAVHALTKTMSIADALQFAETVLSQALNLKAINQGSTAAARHGLLLALASTLQSVREIDRRISSAWLIKNAGDILDLNRLCGQLEGRATPDIEMAMEASTGLIGEICKYFDSAAFTSPAVQDFVSTATAILNHCTLAATRDIVVQSNADAFVEIYKVLSRRQVLPIIEAWLDGKQQAHSAYASKGRLKALSMIHGYLAQQKIELNLRQKILSYAIEIVQGRYKIETRVDAMEALGTIISHGSILEDVEPVTTLSNVLQHGLTDYTNDQRGDIGSLLRLQTLKAVDEYQRHRRTDSQSAAVMQDIMPLVVKLSAEKLNNVRFRAWKCLEDYWQTDTTFPALRHTWQYTTDVSSTEYFQQLMQLLSIPWMQRQLVLGFASSASSGTEDICRAASTAFLLHIQFLEPGEFKELVATVWTVCMEEMGSKSTADDRQVIPLLEFLCFMIDVELVPVEVGVSSGDATPELWTIMQSIHGPASSLQRIEASLNVYSRLLSIEHYRARALDKLTRQLLHRWPKVRYCRCFCFLG